MRAILAVSLSMSTDGCLLAGCGSSAYIEGELSAVPAGAASAGARAAGDDAAAELVDVDLSIEDPLSCGVPAPTRGTEGCGVEHAGEGGKFGAITAVAVAGVTSP
jgi:hypothetical protein